MATSDNEQGLGRTVQELAMNGFDEPPKRFIRNEEERPNNSCPITTTPIPVIDLQLLFSSSAETKQTEMDKLRSALQSWCCFQAVGHGISSSLLEQVREVGREFFGLPKEEKVKWSKVLASPGVEEGREGYGNDGIGSADQILDWSDRLYLLVLPEDQRSLQFWPENPAAFREILHQYILKTKEIANQILRTMAELLGLEKSYFQDHFGQRAPMFARFNYYPPCSRPDLVLGFKPHSDGGGLTILLQDKEIEGLQFLKDNKWFQIPTMPHALLINIGDQMEIMSNGIFKSPMHRVVTNSKKERMSLALVYSPEDDREIGPAEGLLNGKMPRLYKNVAVKDYLTVFFENYMQGKRAIHFAEVSQEAQE